MAGGKNALSGFFGVVLFLPSFIVLFWNEGRAIHTYKGLEEGAGAVISVPSNAVNPSHEGKVIHSSGNLTTGGPVIDDLFLLQAPDAVKLERVVEMYQWKESKSGDYYKYEKEWSPEPIDSSKFKEASFHQNPLGLPYPRAEFLAKEVKMNAFRLSSGLIGQLSDAETMNLSQADLDGVPPNLKGQLSISNGKFYTGKDPLNPQIGDTWVSYRVVRRPSLVTVVAMQSGDSLHPYLTKQGTMIEMIAPGEKTSQEMFQEAMTSNRMLTWGLRVWGFLMMFIGLHMILRPLNVLAAIPFVGSLVGAGVSLISFLVALALSLATISTAWIYYRPFLGAILLMTTVGLFFLAGILLKKGRAKIPVQGPSSA